MRVLILDDSATIRQIVKIYLMNEGLTITEAGDGESGLASVRSGEVPHLVLADLKMPRLDGMGFLKALRNDARTHKVPVVILTGEKAPRIRETVLAAGALDVLYKPVTAPALQSAIRRIREAQ
jgi:two-component system chemotaxis response regulator CheY